MNPDYLFVGGLLIWLLFIYTVFIRWTPNTRIQTITHKILLIINLLIVICVLLVMLGLLFNLFFIQMLDLISGNLHALILLAFPTIIGLFVYLGIRFINIKYIVRKVKSNAVRVTMILNIVTLLTFLFFIGGCDAIVDRSQLFAKVEKVLLSPSKRHIATIILSKGLILYGGGRVVNVRRSGEKLRIRNKRKYLCSLEEIENTNDNVCGVDDAMRVDATWESDKKLIVKLYYCKDCNDHDYWIHSSKWKDIEIAYQHIKQSEKFHN